MVLYGMKSRDRRTKGFPAMGDFYISLPNDWKYCNEIITRRYSYNIDDAAKVIGSKVKVIKEVFHKCICGTVSDVDVLLVKGQRSNVANDV